MSALFYPSNSQNDKTFLIFFFHLDRRPCTRSNLILCDTLRAVQNIDKWSPNSGHHMYSGRTCYLARADNVLMFSNYILRDFRFDENFERRLK